MNTLLVVLALSVCVAAQSVSHPLTKPEACAKFRTAVVSIDVPPGEDGGSMGTGFIVSFEGLVLTAAHVVVNKQAENYFHTIEVATDYANIWRTAVPVTPIAEALRTDVAVLRINDVPKRLPHLQADVVPLEISEQSDIQVGEDIVMIGSPIREGMSNQLCLFGTVAETFRGGPVLYQGVAVQGMSGGPMISLETGKVIGIIDQRGVDLTGLGKVGDQLSQAAAPAANKQNEGDGVARVAIAEVVQILKNHMNNGLGVGVGAAIVHYELEEARKKAQTP